MMGRQSGQLSMMVMDLSELIPNNHLLRRISQVISFDFIYEILEPYYPSNGRPSIDPISMFKMLLVGYLYGIKSERRLVQEIQLNIAYRWFCGFELADKIPDHSTFSKTRLRKWNESQLFQQVFLEIVRRCVKSGLVDGKELAADGTYLPANVSRDSWIETEVEAELSMQSYLDRLDEELSKQPGFKKPPIKTIKKRRTTSKTDPDSGCINHGKKSGLGYLMETTVDCKCGIITGVDVYPANEKESLLVLRHLERQIQNGVPMQNIALDRGYDTGAVHRGLELLGITGYIPAIQFSNSPEKYGFVYLPQEDAFCCPEGARLVYQRLNCSQTTGKYLRCYQVQGETCKHCKRKSVCFKQTGIRRRILGSSCYPAFYRGHERIGSDAYWHMMRLRKIWAEGSFSVLKREHCLSKIRKRGILAVTEECLLSAMALNLKRMVKAILLFLYKPRMWVENIVFCPIFHFCQQVLLLTLSIGSVAAYRLYKPLRQMMRNIDGLAAGDLTVRMDATPYRETEQMSAAFNHMADHLEALFAEVYEQGILLRDAEFRLLESQIRPHFIFNILELINIRCLEAGQNSICRVVSNLAQLLRANITHKHEQTISFREELRYVRYYLELQKERFGDSLTYSIDLEDLSILDYSIPKLTIQPLVENSIVHGLEPKRGGGAVRIGIWEEEDAIYIRITDDGVGFDASQLTLDIHSNTPAGASHNHIALSNIARRIQLLYGSKYGMEIVSSPGNGTTITVTVPALPPHAERKDDNA